MKKSLTKLLARMAKDGDVEAVAEFIEEMIGEEDPAVETVVVAPAAPVPETPLPAEEPVTVEVPETHEITIDEESISGIIERLDRLIALLTPAAPAGDEDPVEELPEEIAEVVEEALEAVEAAEETAPEAAEEVAALVEEMLDPVVSTTIGEGGPEAEGDEDPDRCSSRDALRAALKVIRPALARMPARKRKKVCADIASRVYGRKAEDAGVYAALARSRKTASADDRDLGRKIMQARNPHYKQ